jgi:prepilin-type N-terminal cleavage/methylation domain-containing protein
VRRLRRSTRAEAGFTLVEVLITIAISTIVLSTITLAVTQGYSSSSQASSRLDRSNLADFAADAFASDAASSATVQPAASACGAGPTALDIAESNGTWVSYAVTGTGGRSVLERRVCDGVDNGAGDAAVRRIGSVTGTATVSTAGTSCASGEGAACTLKVTWSDGDGSFTLSGTRRAG